jgi:penicillin-binding protein 1A
LLVEQSSLLASIPTTLVEALVAAEDHRSICHPGVDPIAVVRALVGRILGRNWGGGSTIEQQLYRTLINRREPTLMRKAREMVGALVLARRFSKVETATAYLVIGYFGAHMNGLGQTLRRLDLDLSTLTAHEAAGIVARLKYPEPRRPTRAYLGRIERRISYILNRMRNDAQQPELRGTHPAQTTASS